MTNANNQLSVPNVGFDGVETTIRSDTVSDEHTRTKDEEDYNEPAASEDILETSNNTDVTLVV